ncbi:MAG: arginine--tRNA ligase [Clostridia bacterium]|nr:arginine--tRNA ligase [Clostridia bacterium]
MDYRKTVIDKLKEVDSIKDIDIESILEIPKDSSMGDFSFPCFRLASVFRKSPDAIANEIAAVIKTDLNIKKIEVVKGYLNFFINKSKMMEETFEKIFSLKERYGFSYIGEKKNVIVEFSSPNIAKPFHIGHLCSTVIGNSLANIYEALGYHVIKVNHLGDWGTQFGKLMVAYENWGDDEKLKEEPIKELLRIYVKFHDEAEENPSLEEQARYRFKLLEDGCEKETQLWEYFRTMSLKEFEKIYRRLNISFDSYAGEQFYSDKMPEVISLLEEKGLLVDSQNAKVVNLDDYDMPPCLIVKSDGASIYATRDIAAAIYRVRNYHFDKNLYIVGTPQALHFKQFFKVLELMGYPWSSDCRHIGFGLVKFKDKKLATRKGDVINLEEVLDESVARTLDIMKQSASEVDDYTKTSEIVGIGAIIFTFLKKTRERDLIFSWEDTLNFEGETGPYVQYSYSRAKSILRKANFNENTPYDCDYLKEEVEIDLLSKLSKFGEMILEAAKRDEPSVIARYAVNISQTFNSFYNANRVIVEDKNVMNARLNLVYAFSIVIKNALALLGIEVVEIM